MRTTLILLVLSLVMPGCGESEPTPLSELRANSPVLKIMVLVDGTVVANGEAVTLDELSARLDPLAKDNGMVWYYREDAGSSPHPVAMDVISLLVDHQLPISLSNQPDFSDIIERAKAPDPTDADAPPTPTD
jgi:hypothetical protein